MVREGRGRRRRAAARYAFRQADGTAGHAVVCDGYRNGNEIHLNLGRSGSGTLWYNIDTVSYGGYV